MAIFQPRRWSGNRSHPHSPQKEQPCWRLDLRLLASRTVRQSTSLGLATQPVVLYGSPRHLIQCVWKVKPPKQLSVFSSDCNVLGGMGRKRARPQKPTEVSSSHTVLITIAESLPPGRTSSAVPFLFLCHPISYFLASPFTKPNCIFLRLMGSHHKPCSICFIFASLASPLWLINMARVSEASVFLHWEHPMG